MGIGGFSGGSGLGQLGGQEQGGLDTVRMRLEQVTQENEHLRQALFAAENKAQAAVDELQAFQARIQPAVAEAAADCQKSRGEAERYKRLAEQQDKQIRALQSRLVRHHQFQMHTHLLCSLMCHVATAVKTGISRAHITCTCRTGALAHVQESAEARARGGAVHAEEVEQLRTERDQISKLLKKVRIHILKPTHCLGMGGTTGSSLRHQT